MTSVLPWLMRWQTASASLFEPARLQGKRGGRQKGAEGVGGSCEDSPDLRPFNVPWTTSPGGRNNCSMWSVRPWTFHPKSTNIEPFAPRAVPPYLVPPPGRSCCPGKWLAKGVSFQFKDYFARSTAMQAVSIPISWSL